MPKKNLSKTGVKKQIQDFFKEIENKTPKQIKKIKKLAMGYNFPLKEFRKNFCKKCFTPYKNPKIRIKHKNKIITCPECGKITRWKLNN